MNYLQKTPFMKTYEELSLLQETIDLEVIKRFITSVNFPESKLEKDIKDCAFHIRDLIDLYTKGYKKQVEALLAILGSKVGRNNPPDSRVEDWKSVQYLHNACKQEEKIFEMTKSEDINIPLKFNPAATGFRDHGDNPCWYVFAEGNSNITRYSDFLYDDKVPVDAKIYLNDNTADKQALEPIAHDAAFLIEFLIFEKPQWRLKQIQAVEDNSIKDNLTAFIQSLNENNVQFDRVNNNLQKYENK